MKDVFLKNAYCDYQENIASATYFVLRPVSDGEFVCSTYLYDNESNFIQVRMGRDRHPSLLVAKYRFVDVRLACDEFFELAQFDAPLWYSGNDLQTQVRSRLDMCLQILEDRFEPDDEEVKQLIYNVGLNKREAAAVRTILEGASSVVAYQRF